MHTSDNAHYRPFISTVLEGGWGDIRYLDPVSSGYRSSVLRGLDKTVGILQSLGHGHHNCENTSVALSIDPTFHLQTACSEVSVQ